ncbi:DUF4139 domain-containing protein [candidate division KSB1 bacterium]|nr:DUF4139 domain-containing protein [candidate division KSB1 bacterium]
MASAADHFLITIYDQNYAVVRDVRSFDLTAGDNQVSFKNLSRLILDEPVRITGHGIAASEQMFQFHRVTDDLLLGQSLGKQVEFVLRDGSSFSGLLIGQPESRNESDSSARFVIEQPGGMIRTLRQTQVVEYRYATKPLDYQIEPVLTCKLNAAEAGPHDVEAKYSLQGLDWSAGYTLELTASDSVAIFSGSARIWNATGRAFDHVRITLVSGQLQSPPKRLRISSDQLATRATETVKGLLSRQPGFKTDPAGAIHVRGGRDEEVLVSVDGQAYRDPLAPPSAFVEELFGLKLFTLPVESSLPEGVEQEFTLIQSSPIKTRTNYEYTYWNNPSRIGVYVSTVNTDSAGLGMPLPAGTVSIYRTREGGVSEYVSEYQTAALAKNDPLRIRVGSAEGLSAVRNQLRSEKGLGSRHDDSWEVRLTNDREAAVDMVIQERFNQGWKILAASAEYRQTSDHTIEFPVVVEPQSELVVTYEVREWRAWKSQR